MNGVIDDTKPSSIDEKDVFTQYEDCQKRINLLEGQLNHDVSSGIYNFDVDEEIDNAQKQLDLLGGKFRSFFILFIAMEC